MVAELGHHRRQLTNVYGFWAMHGTTGIDLSAVPDRLPTGIAEAGHQCRVEAKRVRSFLAELSVQASFLTGRGNRDLVTVACAGDPNGEKLLPALENPVKQRGRRIEVSAAHKRIYLWM